MLGVEEMIEKIFNLDNIGHAYLIKTNDYLKVINIAKLILKNSNPEEPNIEKLVDESIYSDLVIIEPDGQWIKKEQILDLKNKFKIKSSYGGKQIYIIKNAENLNSSSGNTLLKFLEEPEENIIALLITSNKNKVLGTIVSRCQYIALDLNEKLEKENNKEINDIIEFLETKKQNSSFYIYEYISKIEDKNEIKQFFLRIINVYEQALLVKLNCCTKKSEDNELIDKIIKNNTIIDIKKRMNGLIEIIDLSEYNINLKLLVDKLIISMFGVE